MEDAMLRSVLAVILGYAIFAASGFALFQLSGQPPHGAMSAAFVVGFVVYGVAFAVLGGSVAGWLAGRRPAAHGAAVAIVLAVGAVVSLVSTLSRGGVIWTQVFAIALMAPAAAVGGGLIQRARRGAESAAALDCGGK